MSYWKNKRVMVTGGGGFLGSHVVEKLRLAGCTQVCVVEHRDFDLSKADQVQRLFQEQRVDVLLHMAGLVGGIAANKARPVDFFYQNLMMNTLTLHHAWQAGVNKVVAAGAGCGYPEHAPLPLRETNFWDGFPQAESAPYSLAKRMLHVQSIAYWAQHRLPMIVTVPGNIYGPYDNFDLENAHVVPALIRKFVEASEAKRERLVVWGSAHQRATSSLPGTSPRASCGPRRPTTGRSWSTSPRARRQASAAWWTPSGKSAGSEARSSQATQNQRSKSSLTPRK